VPGAGSLGARLPVFVAQAIVFLAIWSVLPFWAYFVYWMLPVYAMVFVADEIRAFCEHAQPVLPDEAADPRRLTTFEPNALERILFAPHNMCYHAEHHLWPFVPYYNLPKLHALIGEQRGIEVRRSYVGFLLRYFAALPSLGAEPLPGVPDPQAQRRENRARPTGFQVLAGPRASVDRAGDQASDHCCEQSRCTCDRGST